METSTICVLKQRGMLFGKTRYQDPCQQLKVGTSSWLWSLQMSQVLTLRTHVSNINVSL